MSSPIVSRRALLGAALLLPVAACARTETSSAPPTATAAAKTTTTAVAAEADHPRLVELERQFDARLGVFALATGTGATIVHRADESFAFCSTFKALATAAVLQRNPLSHLDTVVTYTEADLMKSSFITRDHVATGMTLRDLCDAAVRYSDGTAGNLLVRDLGGPERLTEYTRTLGDSVTRMDRVEPLITEATPGDPRDTTTPRALGANFQKLVLGDALPEDKRAFLRDLLERSLTGAQRIRAGLPQDWTVANKTGTGDYGTLNDIAITWPPASAPLVIAIMSSKTTKDAPYDQALLARTAEYIAATLV
ncbi:class A beta-lactamase [Nocardia sp. NPDC127526]|uniref:class A beta-lactamase n=1 Tax=Nocardia sp. NPDC127526 TaxID=3345393 RepID=UPI0036332A88